MRPDVVAKRPRFYLSSSRHVNVASKPEAVASAEIRALQARTNPHFLFNALNAVAALAAVAPREVPWSGQLRQFLRASFRSTGEGTGTPGGRAGGSAQHGFRSSSQAGRLCLVVPAAGLWLEMSFSDYGCAFGGSRTAFLRRSPVGSRAGAVASTTTRIVRALISAGGPQ